MIAHKGFPIRRAGKPVGWTFVSEPSDGQECPSYRYARPKSVSRNSVRWPSEAVGTVFSTASEGHRTVKTSSTANFGARSTGRTRRAAFTLTELLVVIMVIGILASSILFALYGAIEDAKEARTKAQITKLHDLLMTRWESYRTRPVRLLNLTNQSRRNAKGMAVARLNALRDLMRMEMPDRKTDVLNGPVVVYGSNVRIARPAVSSQYLRRANAVSNWTEEFQDAECLYMIIASIRDISSNGLDFVYEGETGDVDGDGMPEILDAWGRPIAFIRWPAGFLAHPGPDYIYQTADDIPSYSTIQSFVPDANDFVEPEDRDPFDPLRVDHRAGIAMPNATSVNGTAKFYFNYKLYPLVYSGGPDELWDIVRFDYDPSTPSTLISFDYYRNTANNYGGVMNDPYSILPTCGRRLGEPFLNSSGYADNITNHGLGD